MNNIIKFITITRLLFIFSCNVQPNPQHPQIVINKSIKNDTAINEVFDTAAFNKHQQSG